MGVLERCVKGTDEPARVEVKAPVLAAAAAVVPVTPGAWTCNGFT